MPALRKVGIARCFGGKQDAGMAEIVNLRRVRKAVAKARHDEAAAESRVRHGRTAAQKQVDRLEAERHKRGQDGARLDDAPPDGGR
jgi:hypothetical protein